MKKNIKNQTGFSMIEVIMVVGILSILFAISSIALFRSRTVTANSSTTVLLISDLQSQQVKAMNGDSEGRSTNDNYGIKIESDGYTLFHGIAYSPSEPTNYKIEADQGSQYSSTFPNDTILFATGSGEIIGFIDGQNSISLTHSSTGLSKSIELNKLGVIVSNN